VVGLSVDDVLNKFGTPTIGEQYIVTLAEIIKALRSDLMPAQAA